MASIINTNISSLSAQRNLAQSQATLSTSMQRLSSGLRINSAKDDAAGLSIAERMTAQIRGSNQAARNANDGISMAQTAEGDLQQITNNLQRIRELAVQAGNATNNASDRSALNNEANLLISEIDRVAKTSSFNGIKLLDGTFTAQDFQIGANGTANDRIAISSISSARTSSLGVGSGSSYSTTVSMAVATSNALTAGGLTINGYSVGASTDDGVSTSGADSSAVAKAAAINAIAGNTGVTATVGATSLAAVATTAGATAGITINGVALGNAGVITLSVGATAADVAASEMAAAINAVSSQTGVTATTTGTTGGYTLTAQDGRNIDIVVGTAGASGLSAATTTASLTLSSAVQAGITIGGAQAADIGAAVGANAATVTVGAGMASLDLTTVAGAQQALSTIDGALDTVNSSRASLGAYQARFASVVTSLQTSAENVSASRSRIQDADFAAETANLSRAQILQQAGTAMVAQANQLPQGVMALLRQ
jgi:flagellin